MLLKAHFSMKYVINILIICVLFSACGTNKRYVPVRDVAQLANSNASTYTVQKGDTLYSIAWRHDIDYQQLAKINNIGKKFDIYPGQVLQIKPKKLNKTSPVIKKNSIKKSASSQQKLNKNKARSKKETQETSKKTASNYYTNVRNWAWPAQGKLVNTFHTDNGLNKGIDIQGQLGEPVIAAARGKVVYAGEGLRGYGKLIIVKHNEKFLSAYAHNDKLLVKEEEWVNQGQRIAVMGSSGTDRVKLHFQIRLDGKPVNPIKYLPKRN